MKFSTMALLKAWKFSYYFDKFYFKKLVYFYELPSFDHHLGKFEFQK